MPDLKTNDFKDTNIGPLATTAHQHNMEDMVGDADTFPEDEHDSETPDFGETLESVAKEEEAAAEPTIEEKAAAQIELDEANDEADDKGDEVDADAAATVEETTEEETTEEEEEEAPVKEAEQAVEKKKLRQTLVPKSRLEQEVARKHAALDELARMKAELDESKSKMDSKPLADALAQLQEGEATVEDVMAQLVNTMASQVSTAKGELKIEAKQDLMHEVEQKDFMVAVDELQNEFDFFNPKAETFDEGLTNEVVAIRDTYVNQGYPQADALRKAARMVIAAEKPELLYETPAEPDEADEAPADAAEAKKTLATQTAAAVTAKGKNVKAKVAAAENQPPVVTSSRGENVVELDLASMSEEDFDALPPSKLAELRGDLVG